MTTTTNHTRDMTASTTNTPYVHGNIKNRIWTCQQHNKYTVCVYQQIHNMDMTTTANTQYCDTHYLIVTSHISHMWYASCVVQHAPYTMQHATSVKRHATCTMRKALPNMGYLTRAMQHPICVICHTTWAIRICTLWQSLYDMRHATYDMWPMLCDMSYVACTMGRNSVKTYAQPLWLYMDVVLTEWKAKLELESLFCLMTSLEHIDFHIIGYWTSGIWSLWHISLEETRHRHIGYSFR